VSRVVPGKKKITYQLKVWCRNTWTETIVVVQFERVILSF
jgi:hypothetical protein